MEGGQGFGGEVGAGGVEQEVFLSFFLEFEWEERWEACAYCYALSRDLSLRGVVVIGLVAL
jgi:hypothetical protein